MKIYRIFSSNINNRTIRYEETPIVDNLGELEWTNIEKISQEPYAWNNIEKPYCDCPFIIGAIPVFPLSVLDVLKPLFYGLSIQIIPINVEDSKYAILNTLDVLENVLNEKKSKITRYSDGRIMDIEKYVLKPHEKIPNMFRLGQFPLFTFISEELYNVIRKLDLLGICFEECKIKKS